MMFQVARSTKRYLFSPDFNHNSVDLCQLGIQVAHFPHMVHFHHLLTATFLAR